MWLQSSAPWGGHSWTAESKVCMFRLLHDVPLFMLLASKLSKYFIIVLHFSEWNPLIARPPVDRCAAVYQQFAVES